MNNAKPLVLAGLASGTILLAGIASAGFTGLSLCEFVGEGWMDHG